MRIGKLVLALGVAALLTTPALAQRGRGGGQGNSVRALATNKSVQEELKVTEDQQKKLTEAFTKLSEDLKDDYAKVGRGGRRGGGGGNNATPEERAAAQKKIGEAEAKAVNGVLDEKQQKRFQQIRVQREGVNAFLRDEDTQKALKLTDEQKDKIKAINDDLAKERQNLFGGGGGGGRGNPEARQKLQALQKEALQNAVKVLSADQQKTYKELTGEPFDYKPDQQGGKPRTDF